MAPATRLGLGERGSFWSAGALAQDTAWPSAQEGVPGYLKMSYYPQPHLGVWGAGRKDFKGLGVVHVCECPHLHARAGHPGCREMES